MGFSVDKGALALLLCLGLTGCIGGGGEVTPPEMPAAPPAAPDGTGDACGAATLQHLVGQPRGAISGMRFAHPLRVYEEGQPVTMDFSPERLNVELSPGGARIRRISCG
ncbi:I78 family peptidase inhibitor [Gemmobacter caeruleus]|uniref:I78 family peptidase inhibitor n=1 Tax=Gemmobacter caeruleus TaxID=2595004 RepID=UPI001EF0B12C|nr:I78 family peptidase inhibitor [Gemmobacter caeruleus]